MGTQLDSIRFNTPSIATPVGNWFFLSIFFFFLLISKRGKNRGLSPLFGYLPTKMTKNTHEQQHTFFFYQSISVLYLSILLYVQRRLLAIIQLYLAIKYNQKIMY